MAHCVHLDYASNAPLASSAKDAIRRVIDGEYYDPRRLYEGAISTRYSIENDRFRISQFIGCDPFEVIFTSSHSESLTYSVYGAIHRQTQIDNPNVIICPYDSQVIEKSIERENVQVRKLNGNQQATINLDELSDLLDEETIYLSIPFAHPDTGTIQDIEHVAELVREKSPYCVIHVDARLAVGYHDINFSNMDIDILTFEPVTFGAPSGIGITILSRDCRIAALLPGSSQERARRAGLENYIAISATGARCEQLYNNPSDYSVLSKTKQQLIDMLNNEGVKIIDPGSTLENIIAAHFVGVAASAVVNEFNRHRINIHAGSSCGSEEFEPSKALMAVYDDMAIAESVFRISFGYETTTEEIELFNNALTALPFSRYKPK